MFGSGLECKRKREISTIILQGTVCELKLANKKALLVELDTHSVQNLLLKDFPHVQESFGSREA